MSVKSYSLGAAEKLKRRKIINALFEEGKSISVSGLRLMYLIQPLTTEYPAQICVSVPKRKIPKAVDRNRIKRLLREAYRLNKSNHYEVLQSLEKQAAIMIIYKGKFPADYQTIQDEIILILERFVNEINSAT